MLDISKPLTKRDLENLGKEGVKLHLPRDDNAAAKLSWYLQNAREAGSTMAMDYGVMDCVHFCSDAIAVQTRGEPNLNKLWSDYGTTAASAYKYLRSLGVSSTPELIDRLFEKRTVKSQWQRGDIVVVPTGALASTESLHEMEKHAIGIADAPYWWAIGMKGLERGPLADCLACYNPFYIEHLPRTL